MRSFLIVLILLLSQTGFSQNSFLTGDLTIPNGWSHKVYLSVKSNYRTIDIIEKSDIIASTIADSTGHFSFPKSFFSSQDRIYQLHLSPDEEEVEVFIADYSKRGLGRNFMVLVLNNQSNVVIEKSSKQRLFGPVICKNKNAAAWQQLEKAQTEFKNKAFGSGNSAEDHFFSNYHSRLVKIASNKNVLNQFLTCHYLLKESANLSNAYLESIATHMDFLNNLKDSHKPDSKHSQQLSKEIDMIQLQLRGLEKSEKDESKIETLSNIIILLGAIMFVLILLIVKLRNKAKKDLPLHLTQREEKIKQYIIQGKSNKEIAEQLYISVSTVKTHINSLYKKENVGNRNQLIDKNSNQV